MHISLPSCRPFSVLHHFTIFSFQVTGKSVSRDSRFQREYEPQAPWPQGLLLEAPPSPKPWRGRSWSDDICQTSMTTNLMGEEWSSQESLASLHSAGSDRLYDTIYMRMGIRAGMGMDLSALDGTESEGIRGASRKNVDSAAANRSRLRSDRAGSGGGRALGNSESGGMHVGAAGYDGKMGWRNTGIGRISTRPDASRPESAGTGSAVKGYIVQCNGDVEHGLPPLAPVPRAGAFPQARRMAGGVAGSRKNEVCAVALTGLPADNAPLKVRAGAATRAPIEPCAEKASPSESIETWTGGVDAQRPMNLSRLDVPRQSTAVAAAGGEHRFDGERGPQSTAAAVTSEAVRGEESVGIKHADPVLAGDVERVYRGVPESNLPDEEGEGHRCGVETSPETDTAAARRAVACDPVRGQPTRASIRQWRHMFFRRNPPL